MRNEVAIEGLPEEPSEELSEEFCEELNVSSILGDDELDTTAHIETCFKEKRLVSHLGSNIFSGGQGEIHYSIVAAPNSTGKITFQECVMKKLKSSSGASFHYHQQISESTSSSLDHNILKLIGVKNIDGIEYAILPFCDIVLDSVIHKVGRDPHTNILLIMDVIYDLCHAFKYLHQSKNIAHQDINPKNIVYYKGHWMLIDFETASSRENTLNGTQGGTLSYIHPARVCEGSFDRSKGDLYAFGLTLKQLLGDSISTLSFSEFQSRVKEYQADIVDEKVKDKCQYDYESFLKLACTPNDGEVYDALKLLAECLVNPVHSLQPNIENIIHFVQVLKACHYPNEAVNDQLRQNAYMSLVDQTYRSASYEIYANPSLESCPDVMNDSSLASYALRTNTAGIVSQLFEIGRGGQGGVYSAKVLYWSNSRLKNKRVVLKDFREAHSASACLHSDMSHQIVKSSTKGVLKQLDVISYKGAKFTVLPKCDIVLDSKVVMCIQELSSIGDMKGLLLILDVMRDILKSLSFLHGERQTAHMDIKPLNIGYHDSWVLLDLDSLRLLNVAGAPTPYTCAYAHPGLIANNGKFDGGISDLYALGITLKELLGENITALGSAAVAHIYNIGSNYRRRDELIGKEKNAQQYLEKLSRNEYSGSLYSDLMLLADCLSAVNEVYQPSLELTSNIINHLLLHYFPDVLQTTALRHDIYLHCAESYLTSTKSDQSKTLSFNTSSLDSVHNPNSFFQVPHADNIPGKTPIPVDYSTEKISGLSFSVST